MPRKPPKVITAYATRPLRLSIMTRSIVPIRSPLLRRTGVPSTLSLAIRRAVSRTMTSGPTVAITTSLALTDSWNKPRNRCSGSSFGEPRARKGNYVRNKPVGMMSLNLLTQGSHSVEHYGKGLSIAAGSLLMKPEAALLRHSDRSERLVRPFRQFDTDPVAVLDLAARQHDGHDAGLALQISGHVARQGRGHEPGLEFVQLAARIAQPGDLDDRLLAEM